jgi:hypothetical protein
MMKRTLIGALVITLALIGTGCKSSSITLETPVVTAEAVNDGGTLRLTWTAVEGATSYEIKAGDSVYTTTSTSFDVAVPVAEIEVRSAKDSDKSDSAATISCGIVEGKAEFYDFRDIANPNGFGFDDNGGVVVCTLNTAGQTGLDFYADSSHAQMSLVVAKMHANGLADQLKAASGSYDAITIADPLGTYTGTKLAVMVDSAYYLRMSADTMWTAADNFAKARIDSIVGSKVSLTTGYQKIPGLRWLVK